VRKFGKVDDNQTVIVKELKKAGCEVLSLAMIGGGCGDLLVQRGVIPNTTLFMLEVKDGEKPPSARRKTPHQIRFHKNWQVYTVTDVETALQAVGLQRSR
jgi:hypothetical protein